MRNISPFVRNLGVLALISLLIVVLNQETALATAGRILSLAFILVMALVVYFLWRDFGRREIGLWPQRSQWVFYGAAGLLVADIGWWLSSSLSGRDALAFFAVAAVAVYSLVRTWRNEQHLA
jgi:hypothetical protein